MRVLNLEGARKSSINAHALIFNPLVSRILLKRSALKRASQADIKQRKLLQVESRRIQKEKQRLLEEKRRFLEEKRLIRDQANRSSYKSYHRRCGHANLKNLITFKRHGKVTASRLPSRFLRNYRKDCPMMIVLLLFLQKQNLAYAVYQFGSVLSLPD
jgi:3-oxoacyl-[acyl-carrier-protein] synthase III